MSRGRSLGIIEPRQTQTFRFVRKMESLINSASNGFLCQSCENMKENLSFLQKELLANDEFMKSLLETQTAILYSLSNLKLKLASWSSSRNCSTQNEEDMENKAEKVNIKSNNQCE